MSTTSTIIKAVTNEAHILLLHPQMRELVREFLQAAADAGISLKITSSRRSMDEQQRLYNQGRTTPGAKVTNAKPGSSYHNFSLAIDVVEIKNGKALWEKKDGADWDRIGRIGKAVGLRWGGDFSTIVDKPHFEYPGASVSLLLARYNQNQLDSNGFLNKVG